MQHNYSEIKEKIQYRRQDVMLTADHKEKSRYSFLNEGDPKKILIHGVPFLITIDENDRLRVFTDRSILIEDGIIKLVFKASALSHLNLRKVDLIYDAEQRGGMVVTAGLVNSHTHPPMYLLRSTLTFAEDNLEKTLKGMARLEGMMDSNDFFLGAVGDFVEEQKGGISTTLSHYGIFDPIEKAAVTTNHQVINALSALSNSHPENTPAFVERYLRKADNFYTKPAIAIHLLEKAHPKILRKIASLQKKYKALFTLHLAETELSAKRVIERHGDLPVKVLDRYHLLNPLTLLSHAIHITKEEILLIKKRKAGVVHLPTSNLLHKSGVFNYPLFHELKATSCIALGTDSVVSKNRLDLLTEALQTKTMHQQKKIVPYEELFNMITAQGAKLLGLKKVGKILPGYRADLAFWNLKDRGFLPYDADNPITLVTNMITYGSRTVNDLMINGRFVISNRKHNLVKEGELLFQLQEAHMRLRKKG